MPSFGYFLIKFICLNLFGVFDPTVAEAVGPFIDLELVGFAAFIFWIDILRPRGAEPILKYLISI
ncbi:NS7c protein [Sparrow deltacoronavirus]|nr:NS7c protein [Sparrow deltacoronavirus]AWV67123.1 NS7c protein [Sparrow deltacoronavirus]